MVGGVTGDGCGYGKGVNKARGGVHSTALLHIRTLTGKNIDVSILGSVGGKVSNRTRGLCVQ